jgi:hypothetical protein
VHIFGPWQAVSAASGSLPETSVFRYRHFRHIQTVENLQPFAFARKLDLPRSPYVCLCVPDKRFIS